jgi:hypothetical protein
MGSAHGLHASPTPRDSVRNVYGQRWFADAAAALTAAYAGIHNVAIVFAAANIAEQAATAARTAAASGAVAHAAAVAAAGGTYAPDTASDAYFAAWSAATAHPSERHYLAQNAHLLELIAGTSKTRLIDAARG